MPTPSMLLTLLILVFVKVDGSNDHQGLDDWGVPEVSKFFKDSGINVKSAELERLQLSGNRLMSIDNDMLATLGLSDMEQARIIRKIEAMRKGIDQNPVDVFEWRAAHLRLSDYWICPLLQTSPRAALIWARYLDNSHAIERINNEIDEIPLWEFWLKWIVAPSYPFCQIAHKFNSSTYIDDILEWTFFVASLIEVVSLFITIDNIRKAPLRTLGEVAVTIGASFVAATFLYYVVYWFVPTFINHILFYIMVYVTMPIKLIWVGFKATGALALLGIVGAAEAATSKDSDKSK